MVPRLLTHPLIQILRVLAEARPVRARAQGQQVAVQQEAAVRGAQAERRRPERQPEEERLARVARLSRVEPSQHDRVRCRREDQRRERYHRSRQGKVRRAGIEMRKGRTPRAYCIIGSLLIRDR